MKVMMILAVVLDIFSCRGVMMARYLEKHEWKYTWRHRFVDFLHIILFSSSLCHSTIPVHFLPRSKNIRVQIKKLFSKKLYFLRSTSHLYWKNFNGIERCGMGREVSGQNAYIWTKLCLKRLITHKFIDGAYLV